MIAVILAGGLGTRLSEETHLKPKPMVNIGGKPILWHIMKIYAHHGINDFIICCGYKGYIIKEYFSNYLLHNSDVTINTSNNTIEYHNKEIDAWKLRLIDTGELTLTGERLKRVSTLLSDEECFCFTYGDGLSNVNIDETIKFHKKHGKLATITAVTPPGRFGALQCNENQVTGFLEKSKSEDSLINGGFWVLSPKVIPLIKGPNESWEIDPVNKLIELKQLMAFKHYGFWQPMDTLREKEILENMWRENKAPWKIW